MKMLQRNKLESLIAKKKIFITGASGFIGKHLCKTLNDQYNIEPRVLLHISPIEGIKVKESKGDILDLDFLKKGMEGIDVVVHCANSYDTDLNWNTSVLGTKNICEAAVFCKVKKVIYLSSTAVYGYDLSGRIDEKSPYQKVKGDVYNNSKIEAEKIVLSYFKKYHLPVVILQPTIVYGPVCLPWTIDPLLRIKNDSFFWVNGGEGSANPVFVSDVVQAILLAAIRDLAIGESFIISSGQSISWREFFRPYFLMLKKPFPENIDSPDIKVKSDLFAAIYFLKKMITKSRMHLLIPKKMRTKLKKPFLHIENMMDFQNDEIYKKLFSYQCVFDISKARKILGFKPQVSFENGMKLIKRWFRKNRSVILSFEIY